MTENKAPLQSRNVSVADKSRMHLAILDLTLVRARHFEIEHTHSESLLTLVSPAVARAHHHPRTGFFLASKINHRMRNRGIALNCIGTGPEEQVARFQIIEFKGILFLTHHRLESSSPSQPDVLLAGIARHALHPVLFEDKIDEAGAIHPAVTWISGAVLVIEIASREFERRSEKLLHF